MYGMPAAAEQADSSVVVQVGCLDVQIITAPGLSACNTLAGTCLPCSLEVGWSPPLNKTYITCTGTHQQRSGSPARQTPHQAPAQS